MWSLLDPGPRRPGSVGQLSPVRLVGFLSWEVPSLPKVKVHLSILTEAIWIHISFSPFIDLTTTSKHANKVGKSTGMALLTQAPFKGSRTSISFSGRDYRTDPSKYILKQEPEEEEQNAGKSRGKGWKAEKGPAPRQYPWPKVFKGSRPTSESTVPFLLSSEVPNKFLKLPVPPVMWPSVNESKGLPASGSC